MIRKRVRSKERERKAKREGVLWARSRTGGLRQGILVSYCTSNEEEEDLKKHATCAATDGRLKVLILAMNSDWSENISSLFFFK